MTYDTVCDGDGNTEVVRVTFDASVTSYEAILDEFWAVSGSRAHKARPKAQYKSAIFVSSEAQREAARASMAARAGQLAEEGRELVTELLPLWTWHDAEERHQGYVMKHRAKKAERANEAQSWVDAWKETERDGPGVGSV